MKRFHIIYLLVGLASWLGTLFLVGCANDTGSLPDQTSEEELIPVTISIGVDDAEKLFTRAEGDENEGGEEATPEEPTAPTYTATPIEDDANVGDDLVVYIMGRDNLTLNRTDFTYEDTHRYVAEVRLYRGTYQAYAFANHTGFYLALPDAIEENPAVNAISLVSETNGIPMSGEAEWEVNAAGEYEVQLVRMVGRMDVTIADERGEGKEGKVQSVTISNLLPAQTNLLREGKGEVTLPYNVDFSEWIWSPTLDSDNKANASFYLHETKAGEERFDLTVSFEGADNRGVKLTNEMIPRNYKFPLNIYIRDYALILNITTEVPPIGGIATPEEQGNYDVKLPEGSTFSVKAKFKKNGEEVTTATSWKYWLDEEDERIQFTEESEETTGTSISFSGITTAQSFDEEKVNTMHITVVDPENGKEIPFKLNFYIRALKDEENTKSLGSASTEVQPVIVEL